MESYVLLNLSILHNYIARNAANAREENTPLLILVMPAEEAVVASDGLVVESGIVSDGLEGANIVFRQML